jgi:hypothetical protein
LRLQRFRRFAATKCREGKRLFCRGTKRHEK